MPIARLLAQPRTADHPRGRLISRYPLSKPSGFTAEIDRYGRFRPGTARASPRSAVPGEHSFFPNNIIPKLSQL
jgi:hypothetical protein